MRFRQPEKVQQVVMNAVRRRLQGEDLTAPLRIRQVAPPPIIHASLSRGHVSEPGSPGAGTV